MKKTALILVLALLLTMTACGNTAETTPVETTAPAQTEAAKELTIEVTGYSETTNLDDFWITGTITSGANLVRMEVNGTLTSAALGLSVSDSGEFVFPENVTTYDMADLADFFKESMNTLYNLYVGVASLLGVDDALKVDLTFTVYDANGSTYTEEISAMLTENNAVEADGISLTGFETPESGTLERFQISGTVSSDVPLVKISGQGKAKSNAADIVVTDMSMPYYFEEGVTSVELSEVRDYILENMGTIFNLFGVMDMENHEVTVEYTFVCEDEAGKTVEFTVNYVVTGE